MGCDPTTLQCNDDNIHFSAGFEIIDAAEKRLNSYEMLIELAQSTFCLATSGEPCSFMAIP